MRRNRTAQRAIIALLLLGAACVPPAAAREVIRGPSNHGAIAYHAESASVGWATDRRTNREARVEALRQCGHPNCEVVVSIRGGCAALARGSKAHAVQKGATRAEAETKALRRCGAGCAILAWACTR